MKKVTAIKTALKAVEKKESPKEKALEVVRVAACKVDALAIMVKSADGADVGPGLHHMLDEISDELLKAHDALTTTKEA